MNVSFLVFAAACWVCPVLLADWWGAYSAKYNYRVFLAGMAIISMPCFVPLIIWSLR